MVTNDTYMKVTKHRTYCLHPEMGVGRLPKDYPWKVVGWLLADLHDLLDEDSVKELSDILRNRNVDGYLALSKRWGLQSMASAGGIHSPDRAAKYQLGRLLAKYQFPSSADARNLNALKKFKAADCDCRRFNQGRGKYLRSLVDAGSDDVAVLFRAREFIGRVLGYSLPPHDILTRDARHGPGSTLGTVDGFVSSYDKYANWPYTVTQRSVRHARDLIESDPRWLGALEESYRERFDIRPWSILNRDAFWRNVFKVVDSNRVCFVPKDSQTDRPIAIEPCMNLMLQLGVDGFIRKRLKRFGINLDSQLKNQALSCLGSKQYTEYGDFPYSTIDLASASDTVSLRICQILLPREWFQYLFELRSPKGMLPDGSVIRYRKISSMGNGYTFALESLIFAALCYGVAVPYFGYYPKGRVAVFGDDIVVPWQIAPELIHWLEWSGFAVNTSKSFIKGSVKESCGTDWCQGIPIRPVHMKAYPSSLADVLADRNRLGRWLELRMGIPFEESLLVRNLDKYLVGFPTGPLSDENFSSWLHTRKPSKTYWYSYRWSSLVQVPIRQTAGNFGFRKLMASLRSPGELTSRSISPDWLPGGVVESGDVFLVHKRNALRWKVTRSRGSLWPREYVEPDYLLRCSS